MRQIISESPSKTKLNTKPVFGIRIPWGTYNFALSDIRIKEITGDLLLLGHILRALLEHGIMNWLLRSLDAKVLKNLYVEESRFSLREA